MAALTKKLSIIIPAYNKDSEVFEVVSGYVNQLKSQPFDWEIIVVDDASRDKTLREAVRSKKFNGNTHRIKIFSYNLNQGKGFALNYGFKQSRGDIIVFADSDLDIPASNLEVLLKNLSRSSSDIVIASKRHPESVVNYPIFRIFMSKVYQIIIKILFNLNISDTQVGLKAFRREVLENCFPRLVVKQFAFDLELLVVAKKLGFRKIYESPVNLNYKFTSTVRLQSALKILQDTLAIYYRKKFLEYYDTPHYKFENSEKLNNFLQKAYI